jgi:tetratricopeptide (TPR) repeat protein
MTLGHSLPGANRRDGPWQPPAIRSGLVLCALVLSFRPAEGQSAACRELNRTVIEQVTNGQLGKAELALSAVPENPQDPLCTGLILANLAAIRTMQGKYAEAETLAQRSLGLLEEHYAKDSPALLRPLHVLAASRLEQGKVAKAREAFQRMRVLRLDRPMDTALFHDIAGSLLEAEGKPWEAAPEYLAGIRALDDSGHGDTAYAGTLLQALASSYLQQERLDDARRFLDCARDVFLHAKDAVPMDFIKFFTIRAGLYFLQHQWQKAEQDLRQALSMADQESRIEPSTHASLLAGYARVLRKNRHAAEARQVEKRVESLRQSSSMKDVVDVSGLLPKPKPKKK